MRNILNMKPKTSIRSKLSGIPPAIFIGTVLVLLPIFTYITVANIHRQKQQHAKLLLEKSAALAKSVEAGARAGLKGGYWGKRKLQNLLVETALQPDIQYIAVTNTHGRILAHNNPDKIGEKHGQGLALNQLLNDTDLKWRLVTLDETELFEGYGKFIPTMRLFGPFHQSEMRSGPHGSKSFPNKDTQLEDTVIFVGLDVSAIEAAGKSDLHQTIIMATILLLICFSGIIFVFMTQRYRTAEASLSHMKALSETLVENMPLAIIAIDEADRIAACNDRAESILGKKSNHMVKKDISQTLPDELCRLIHDVKEHQTIIEKEITILTPRGKEVPLEAGAMILKNERDLFPGYVLLFKDITELKSLRKEIISSQRLASIGRLAAGVAHEVRNPLSSIKGFAIYLQQRFPDNPEDQEMSHILIQEVERLNKVITQLLEVARPVTISGQNTLMHDFIKNSLKLIEKKVAQQQVQIDLDLSHEVIEARIDRDRMKQVLLNLYLNALDAMPESGRLSVILSKGVDPATSGHDTVATMNREFLKIQVVDNGKGIEPIDLPNIFDPYFTTKNAGTGLGLAIAYNIIKAHEGKIKAESKPSLGTTITVVLPLSKP